MCLVLYTFSFSKDCLGIQLSSLIFHLLDYAYRFILLVPRLICLNDVVTSFQRSIFVIFSVIDFDDGFEQTELSITGQIEGTLVLKFLVLKEKIWF